MPAVGVIAPELIGQGEVVADEQVGAAVAVLVPDGDGQGLGLFGEPLGAEASRLVPVEIDPALIVEEILAAQLGQQPDIIGGRHGVQIAVPVQVRPVHGVGGLGKTAHKLLLEAAGRVGGEHRAAVAPEIDCAADAGQRQIGPAIPVHIDGSHRARAPYRHLLAAEA